MCYNTAKSWQVGWYDDRKLLVEPLAKLNQSNSLGEIITLVGIADYLDPEPTKKNLPVLLKLETGTPANYFVVLNR